MKRFDELSETEVLALAISNEEEDFARLRRLRAFASRGIPLDRFYVRRHGR